MSPWPNDAPSLAAGRRLRMGAAYPHVRQQVNQLQNAGWYGSHGLLCFYVGQTVVLIKWLSTVTRCVQVEETETLSSLQMMLNYFHLGNFMRT